MLIYNICLSLSDLLRSVWQTLGSSTSLQMAQFHSFLWLSNIPCICVLHLYAFICCWTFRLLPRPSYCKWCCNECCGAVLTHFSHVWLYVTPWTIAHRLLCPWGSSGKNTGVGYHAVLQEIFLTEGLNPHVLRLLLWQKGSLLLAPPGKPNFHLWMEILDTTV